MLVESLLLVSTVFLFFVWWSKKKNDKENFPPGPFAFPIWGNLHLLGKEPHKTFIEMGKRYGDIFGLQMGSYRAIVLNDPKDIRTALSLNAFSGRPQFELFNRRNGGSNRGIIFNQGHTWTEQRRFTLKTLRDFGFGKKSIEGIVQEEIKELIESFRKVVGKPMNTQAKFNAAVLGALWYIIAGQRHSQEDPVINLLVQRITSTLRRGRAVGLHLFFPWIDTLRALVPGSYSKSRNQMNQDNYDFIRKVVQEHVETFQEDAPPRDFIDVYLAEMRKVKDPNSSFSTELGLRNLEVTVLDLFLAGAETTATTLSWLFLLLAIYPEIQEKMFNEIKEVVTLTRLPQLSDRPNMPYTEAVIQETLRFSTIAPTSVMHTTTEDVVYKGFTIPKGTLVFPNLYAANRDPKVWTTHDPEQFVPERFLSADGKTVLKPEALVPFSAGKRICLGMTLALDELFLFATTLFQTFRVTEDVAAGGDKLRIECYKAGIRMPVVQNMVLYERNG